MELAKSQGRDPLFLLISHTLLTLLLNSLCIAAPTPAVRVLVERAPYQLAISGENLVLKSVDSGKTLFQQTSSAALEFHCSLGGKIRVGSLETKGPLKIESMTGFLHSAARKFRGSLYIYSFNKDCVAVNELDIERYVAGVLDSEMSASWSIEALKAQAITARTYAIYQMREASSSTYRGLNPPFDLESDVRDQVYEGAHREKQRTLQAVDATRGQVLMYRGKLVKAYYHSTCGGETENAASVWGKTRSSAGIAAVKCGYCNDSPLFRWSFEVPATALNERVSGIKKIGKISKIKIRRNHETERVEALDLVGTKNQLHVRSNKLRELLGFQNLKSTWFSIRQKLDDGIHKLVFEGQGSGHGVGMCQWGARNMAKAGKSHLEILKYYYPKIAIQKAY